MSNRIRRRNRMCPAPELYTVLRQGLRQGCGAISPRRTKDPERDQPQCDQDEQPRAEGRLGERAERPVHALGLAAS
jgi:hypothetical protein